MNVFNRLFYEICYLLRPPWDTGITPPELKAFVQTRPLGRGIDLGCGTGTNALYLALRGWEVTGVDFVGRAIQRARKKARCAGIRVDFRREDVTRLEGLQGPFDLILDIGCFHTLKETGKLRYLENLKRLLAPAGTYLLYAFVRESPESDQGLSPVDLKRLGEILQLIKREDGTDQGRASAWFTFQNASEPLAGE